MSVVDFSFGEESSYKMSLMQFCLFGANCEELSTSECPSCVSGEISSDDECLVPNAR